jgi:hypothetical protein
MKQKINNYRLSTKLISLIFAIGLFFICSSAYCQEEDPCVKKEPVDDKWNFMVTPYFTANSLDLKSTVNGETAHIDIDFADLIDDFDVWAVATRVDARKGKSKWGFFLDGWYINLSNDFRLDDPVVQKVDVDVEQAQVDLAVMYRLFKGLPMKKVGCYLPLSLDVWGGARYAYLKQHIKPISNIPEIPRRIGKSKDWVEPLVGARIQFPLTRKLTLSALGDVSGFGVGSASDRTWTFTSGFDYQLFEKVSIKLAYRIYDIDYSNGSGTSEFGLDGREEGPYLGITFHL